MKNALFQYHDGRQMVEDTDLITLEEAEVLWSKYFDDCKRRLERGDQVQMCIWGDASSNTSYHTVIKEIDYRDCVVDTGIVLRIKKERIV